MIIALTGATGFVGQAVLDEAAARGLAVRALTRRPREARDGVSWVHGDILKRSALDMLIDGAHAVIHVAGVVNAPDPAMFEACNARGTREVAGAALDAGVGRFVHVSSLAAREPELSTYGASKRRGEEIVKASPLDWTVVRPPGVFGPRDTEIFELFRAARWGVVPMPRVGRSSLIHVADLARLLVDLVDGGKEVLGQVYEPDDRREGGWEHRELARAIGAAVGRRVFVPQFSRAALLGFSRADRILRRGKAKLTADRVNYLTHPDWTCDPAKAPPASLWMPRIETETGLAETAEWYRSQGWL